jgi:hypothetical protein
VKDCIHCGAEFEAEWPRARALTCSSECQHAHENERKRRWERENLRPCPRCGKPTGHTSACAELCRSCRDEATAAQSEITRSLVSDLWLDGHDRNEIAALIGWTPASVSAFISKWRKTEPELFPYRGNREAQAELMRERYRGRQIGRAA